MVMNSVDEMELRRVRRSEKSYGYRIIAGQRLAYDALKEIKSQTYGNILTLGQHLECLTAMKWG